MPQLTQLIGDDQGIHTAIALAIAVVVILSQHLTGGPQHPYIKPVEYRTSEFDLDQISPERLRRMMRFNKEEIRLLVDYLAIDAVEWSNRAKSSFELALCLLLYKLSYPRQLFELAEQFGRSPSYLSRVLNDLLKHLEIRYGELLRWHPTLTYTRLRRYARAVKRVGKIRGKSTIWGFIDGTFQRFCRPNVGQKFYYSGYKKAHGMVWLAITCPDGLIGSIYGPCEGKMNDVTMLQKSGLQNRLKNLFKGRRKLQLYGDKAYIHQPYIMSPYLGYTNERQAFFNKRMSGARIVVENSFDLTQTLWIFNAFKTQMKVGLQPVGNLYLAAILLTNCYTCLRGNQIGSRFAMRPPSLSEYLQVDRVFSDPESSTL